VAFAGRRRVHDVLAVDVAQPPVRVALVPLLEPLARADARLGAGILARLAELGLTDFGA
jgi:hypothetical protein